MINVHAEYEQRNSLPKNTVLKAIINGGDTGAWARLERGEITAVEFGPEFSRECSKEVYRNLVDSVDPLGKDRHIHWEAKRRLEELDTNEPDLPEKVAELEVLIRNAEQADSEEELDSANEVLSRIILQFRDQDGYEDVVQYAESSLDRLNRKNEAEE